jgi:hypothetical protein
MEPTQLTDEQLKAQGAAIAAEIARRQRIEDEQNRAERIRYNAEVLPILIPLAIHTFGSCSDANPRNNHNGCPRCWLIVNDGEPSSAYLTITITISEDHAS